MHYVCKFTHCKRSLSGAAITPQQTPKTCVTTKKTPRPSAPAMMNGISRVSDAAMPVAHALTPEEQLAGYTAQSGAPAVPARGQQFFNARQGREWSCASCHGAIPTQAGTHASTGKSIGALAPAFNRERFTDAAKTEKWFRRNCKDVAARECTASEKADVLNWLLTLRQ